MNTLKIFPYSLNISRCNNTHYIGAQISVYSLTHSKIAMCRSKAFFCWPQQLQYNVKGKGKDKVGIETQALLSRIETQGLLSRFSLPYSSQTPLCNFRYSFSAYESVSPSHHIQHINIMLNCSSSLKNSCRSLFCSRCLYSTHSFRFKT